MKNATLLVGLLVLGTAFGCAGGSDDDSESAGGSSSAGSGGKGSGGSSGGSASTGGTAGSGTGGSGGTAGSGTGGGSGGSGGTAGSGTGGGSGGSGGTAGTGGSGGEPGEATASEACKTYCTCHKDNCAETPIPGGVSCYEFCATFESNTDVLGCRQNMCNLVPAQPENGHCVHSVGEGQCTL